MSKIRLGVVYGFPFGDGGGLDRAVAAILCALNRAGFEVELVTFGDPDLDRIRMLYGFDFTVERVHGDSWFYSLPIILRLPVSTIIGLYHAIRVSKSNRVMIFAGGRFQPTRFIAYRRHKAICYQFSPRWRPTPRILAEKGVSPLKKMFRIAWDNTWPRPLGPCKDDLVIAHNSYAKNTIENEFGIRAKYVLSLPAPDRPPIGVKKNKQVVHFGRFHPEKRHDVALRIMSLVKEQLPDSKFVLMGLANLPEISGRVLGELQSEIERLGLMQSVRIIKNPSFEQVLEVLAKSKIIMSMQIDPETYNMTIIEGMSQGCVAVLPRVNGGAWEDILDNGKFGFGFDSEKDGAETISRLLSLPESEFSQLSARSRQRAEFFGIETFTRRLDEIIQGFIGVSKKSALKENEPLGKK
jgi:glycosyltransferase involved in cell wall biosynthesis